jgi:amino acid transporter
MFKNKRNVIQTANKNMDLIRKIKVKNLKQQKQFINLKYPKKPKFIFTWRWLLKIILILGISICLFILYNKLFKFLKIDIALWLAILIIIVCPIIINLLLKKFNLQQDDLTVLIK